MKKTEREHVEAARDCFRKAEALIRRGLASVEVVAKLSAAEHPRRSNAAFMAHADMDEAFAAFRKAHGRGTEVLFANWPEFAGEVVAMGPPR